MRVYPAITNNGKTFTGPGADGTNGQYMKTDGSLGLSFGTPGGGGGGLTITGTKTANYTASDGDHVICDSNGAAGDFTVTLPASPSSGNQVRATLITDHATRIVDIGRNAENLNGSTDATVWRLVQEGDTVLFTYTGGDAGWLVDDGIRAAVACITRTTDQTITASATWTKLQLSTETYNNGATTDVATNYRITVRRAGTYTVMSRSNFSALLNAKGSGISLYVNGTRTQQGTFGYQGATGYHLQSVSADMVLAAGDYLEAFVWQNDSTSENVDGDLPEAQPILWIRESRKP